MAQKASKICTFCCATQRLSEELFKLCWNVGTWWDGNAIVVLCWGPKIWNLHCYFSAIVAMVRLAVFSQSTAVGPAQERRRSTDYDGPSEISLETLEMMKLSSEQLVPFATIGHLFDQILLRIRWILANKKARLAIIENLCAVTLLGDFLLFRRLPFSPVRCAWPKTKTCQYISPWYMWGYPCLPVATGGGQLLCGIEGTLRANFESCTLEGLNDL